MVNNKNMTAVEWLEKQLLINGSGAIKTFPELFEQAAQMEKEQITEAHLQGLYSEIKMRGEKQAEQYYNENYGKN